MTNKKVSNYVQNPPLTSKHIVLFEMGRKRSKNKIKAAIFGFQSKPFFICFARRYLFIKMLLISIKLIIIQLYKYIFVHWNLFFGTYFKVFFRSSRPYIILTFVQSPLQIKLYTLDIESFFFLPAGTKQ